MSESAVTCVYHPGRKAVADLLMLDWRTFNPPVPVCFACANFKLVAIAKRRWQERQQSRVGELQF